MSQVHPPPTRLRTSRIRAKRLLLRIWDRLDLKQRRCSAAFSRLRQQFYRDYFARAAAGVGAHIDDLGGGFSRVHREGRAILVHGGSAMIDSRLSFFLTDNKPVVLRIMNELGIPIPRHEVFTLDTIERAHAFLHAAEGAVVVKPAEGTGAGSGVTTGIRNQRELLRAAYRAARSHTNLLVEDECAGSSYRLLYLGGKLIDAIRRDAPSVEGDGRRTIRQLITAETEARLRANPVVSLHPITIDEDSRVTLEHKGLSLASIPDSGSRIVVKNVANQNAARDNHVVRSLVHPTIEAAGRRLSDAVGLRLAGVDVMTTDISVPLAETGGCIHEVNAGPGLHHHVLVAEPVELDVGAAIIDYMFSNGVTIPHVVP